MDFSRFKHFKLFLLDWYFDLIFFTAVRTPVGCYTQVGVLVESDQSGKFTSSFPTAWFPAQRNPSPFWIVAMNSKSWALIYSCRKLSEDGSCERKHTTAWTMSRSPDGFTNEVAQEVHAAVDALCIEYDDFQPMPKSTTCPEINPDDFPNVVKPKAELWFEQRKVKLMFWLLILKYSNTI